MVTMGTGTFRGPATRRSGRVGLTSFTPASIVGKLVGNLLALKMFWCSPILLAANLGALQRIARINGPSRAASAVPAHGYLAHP
jgi:hypothetical protein